MIKSLTCKGLVPLANTIWFSTKPLNIFQIGFRMKKPLCLWWRGDEHGSCGLLHNWLTCWALAGIRRGCLLSRRTKDSYLQWQKQWRDHIWGNCREAASHLCIRSSSYNGASKQVSKGIRKFFLEDTHFSQGYLLWSPRCTERGSANKPYSYLTDNIGHISNLCKHILITITISPLSYYSVLNYSFCLLFISCFL